MGIMEKKMETTIVYYMSIILDVQHLGGMQGFSIDRTEWGLYSLR